LVLGPPGTGENTDRKSGRNQKSAGNSETISGADSGNISDRFAVAESLSKDNSRLNEIINIWTIIVREAFLGNHSLIKMNRKKAVRILEKIRRNQGNIEKHQC